MKVTVYDVEQEDPVRIKQERDILIQAIYEMGVRCGMIDPESVVTAPHLLMILEEINS